MIRLIPLTLLKLNNICPVNLKARFRASVGHQTLHALSLKIQTAKAIRCADGTKPSLNPIKTTRNQNRAIQGNLCLADLGFGHPQALWPIVNAPYFSFLLQEIPDPTAGYSLCQEERRTTTQDTAICHIGDMRLSCAVLLPRKSQAPDPRSQNN